MPLDPKTFGILVLVRNQPEDLKLTLTSIHESLLTLSKTDVAFWAAESQMMVWDNGSRPDFADQIKTICNRDAAIFAPYQLWHERFPVPRSRFQCLSQLERWAPLSGFTLVLEAGMKVQTNFFKELSAIIKLFDEDHPRLWRILRTAVELPGFGSGVILPSKILGSTRLLEGLGRSTVFGSYSVPDEILDPLLLFVAASLRLEVVDLLNTSLEDGRSFCEWSQANMLRGEWALERLKQHPKFSWAKLNFMMRWFSRVLKYIFWDFIRTGNFKQARLLRSEMK